MSRIQAGCVKVSAVVAGMALLLAPAASQAQAVRLKNDTLITGNAVAVQAVSTVVPRQSGEIIGKPVTLIDAGIQRYYVPTSNVVEKLDTHGVGGDVFRLPQRSSGRGLTLGAVGPLSDVEPFDEHGRRTISIDTSNGPLKIHQGITEIRPQYLRVTAFDLAWEYGISTTAIPTDALDRMIRQVTDQKNPNDRFAIARFYVYAGLFLPALSELEAIAREFPDLKARAEENAQQARQELARQLLDELSHRRSRGQHRLAYLKARQFPTEGMSAAIVRQVREFLNDYDTAREEGEHALALVGEFQSQLKDGAQREAVEAMRVELRERMNYETLPRLRPFLQQADDDSLGPDEKLALACSAWLLGENAATDRLDLTINLWRARFQILRYLRSTDVAERRQILADLLSIEGVGPQTVLDLIPLLGPALESAGVRPGAPAAITVSNAHADVPPDAPEVRYHVLLPTEYSHDHACPLVVALHGADRSPDWELRWWGGTETEPLQAQRHGYIVIAPEYMEPGEKVYSYNALAHYRVLMAIRDARKRFNIDSDHIFLSGHGSGGDAAFDLGCSHPDQFAGVMPITGTIENTTVHTWKNGRRVPWYIISGQLDRNVFNKNAGILTEMMEDRFDVILTEYVGRGYESYYSEIHKLFAWMELHRRERYTHEFNLQTMRPNSNRFHWLKADLIPDASGTPAMYSRPKLIRGEILDGADRHTLISISSPARSHTLWLAPELVDFSKRLHVRVGARQKFNGFVEASVETILEDLRLRGDRQMPYQARLDLN